ncbi:MAG TPA: hypothetical protein PKZ22_03485 [Accumulibacter sp.]|jgi:hypothetical protein|nr:hypothetical protein [Accumulibacter sp.]
MTAPKAVAGKELSHATVSRRGRPSNYSKFLARQGDLFADEQYRAELEAKYPYLGSLAARSETRPQRSEDEGSERRSRLGKPIRILLSTTPTDEAGGA